MQYCASSQLRIGLASLRLRVTRIRFKEASTNVFGSAPLHNSSRTIQPELIVHRRTEFLLAPQVQLMIGAASDDIRMTGKIDAR
ncbi:MAG TPA: hypothetical protein VE398_22845 [Acidobacteriota bacterium]|nr:hypothetical protein [Acidobacteriota bacterium]